MYLLLTNSPYDVPQQFINRWNYQFSIKDANPIWSNITVDNRLIYLFTYKKEALKVKKWLTDHNEGVQMKLYLQDTNKMSKKDLDKYIN